jgi:hypothetical protein
MRKSLLWVALFIAVILYLARVSPEEMARAQTGSGTAPLAPVWSAEPQVRQSTSLTLVDRHGAEVRLTIDENTEVLVLGTWCVYSRRLNDVLKDGLARRYLLGKRLVYIFDYNELVHRAAVRVTRGELSQEQLDAYVRSQPRGALLMDQEFLRRVAAQRVLYFDEKHPIQHDAVPSAFSGPPNRFELNHGTWLVRNLKMPLDVKEKLFKLHPVEGEG